MRIFALDLLLVVSLSISLGQTLSALPAGAASASATPPAIVIGFVGGFISHDNAVHGGVQLAAQLRKDYPSSVHVQVFENHHGEQAHQEILRLLDTNHDGKLSLEEKQNARIIIYGHSWGGSETVTLARELQSDGIPVLLTIQVDSVTKFGEDDLNIPANVAEAANFYQSNGYLHGRSEIRAADPKHTQIIGNIRLDYASNPVQCNGYPWFARAFEKPHIEIECDPNVLNRVESLILSKLPPPAPSASLQ
ncbi:MAG: hypothetical protein WB007_12610 [Candidatus Acidiferrales bacterium]